MEIFYVTFPTRYKRNPEFRRDVHPEGMHGDGWAEITAESQNVARDAAFKVFGERFAFIYTDEDFKPGLYPAGCLLSLTATPDVKVPSSATGAIEVPHGSPTYLDN